MTDSPMKNCNAAFIALVGSEATGKSTLANEIGRWLGERYSVRVIHAGKPPATWVTWPLHVLLPLLRKLMPALRTSRIEGHVAIKKPIKSGELSTKKLVKKTIRIRSIIYATRAVCIAWDRHHLLVKRRNGATNKEFIVCDRYPSNKFGEMDSARLVVDVAQKGFIFKVYNLLARLENRLYQQIPPPDIVLQLYVSVETAKQRNRNRIKADKNGDKYIESRYQQAGSWQRKGRETIHHINTEQSLLATIQDAKDAIESALNG